MTADSADLSKMGVTEIVDLFAKMAIEQDHTLLYDDYDRYNQLYREMDGLGNNLKTRGDQARLALVRLFGHPNRQVRMAAANATLAVAPIAARDVLKSIVNEKWFPQALSAGMTLQALDDGLFKPT